VAARRRRANGVTPAADSTKRSAQSCEPREKVTRLASNSQAPFIACRKRRTRPWPTVFVISPIPCDDLPAAAGLSKSVAWTTHALFLRLASEASAVNATPRPHNTYADHVAEATNDRCDLCDDALKVFAMLISGLTVLYCGPCGRFRIEGDDRWFDRGAGLVGRLESRARDIEQELSTSHGVRTADLRDSRCTWSAHTST
jgi:hypothetical protein